MTDAARLAWLARLSRRRRYRIAAVQALSVGLLLAAPLRYLADATVPALAAGVLAAVVVWYRLQASAQRIDARAMARHLDERFADLADSTELLLAPPSAEQSPLQRLQRKRAAQRFQQLDSSGALVAAVPPFASARAAAWLAPAVLVATAFAVFTDNPTHRPDATAVPAVVDARVRLTPLDYTGAPPSTVNKLDFETLAGASVRWQLAFSAPADEVALVFHNGETLALTAEDSRTWRSPEWLAFATVYRIVADGVELPGNFHRVTTVPDKPPEITVGAPTEALTVLQKDDRKPLLALALAANDDYGLESVTARVTLARGTGEQLRFREKALPLPAAFTPGKRALSVNETLDLEQLGMERGDELFLYAEVSDNRPGQANVASTSTFIVRWLADEVLEATQVTAVAVSVLPETFRSQRQIIIDTEQLLAERAQLDGGAFSQRSQNLAVEQKMLRLRYGQFLGEEAESAIGELPDQHDAGPQDEGAHDDDHAGHEEPQAAAFGDAAAAMAPWMHLHDTTEHATLFDAQTRGLLKSALAQMWQAELQLRLAKPAAALPFEYRALEFIKRVQQGSRIYLRRAGFQPTPLDEGRRLTGELDDIASVVKAVSNQDERNSTRLRRLLAALNQPYQSLPAVVKDTAPLIDRLAATDSDWLDALRAVNALNANPDCRECAAALSSALWRQLDPPLAAPGSGEPAASPLAQAFKARIQSGPSR